MKRVTLDQRSNEWHEWRRNGIGASEAPVLTKESKYQTPYQLWEEKCGFKAKSTYVSPAMEHGILSEATALAAANAELKIDAAPLCVEHEKKPFIRASLDGYDENSGTILEIKCPVNEEVLDQARLARLQPAWLTQVAWQWLIAEPEKAYIVVWDHRIQKALVIEHKPAWKTLKDLEEKATDFWRRVRMSIPPALSGGDYPPIEDEKIQSLLEEYGDLLAQEKDIRTQKDHLKAKLAHLSGGEPFRCGDFTMGRTTPRAYYNYKQMEADGIDITKYVIKKEAPPSFTIRKTSR